MIKKVLLFLCFLFFLLLNSCAVYDYRGDYLRTYEIQSSKKDVFNAALEASMKKGLDVCVFESESGLIRFENHSITLWELDHYCEWPWVKKRSRKPYRTFSSYDFISRLNDQGNVRGIVSITVLVSDNENNFTIRSDWRACNNVDFIYCNSKGLFEHEFISLMKSKIWIGEGN